jgi:hypothetical protein
LHLHTYLHPRRENQKAGTAKVLLKPTRKREKKKKIKILRSEIKKDYKLFKL